MSQSPRRYATLLLAATLAASLTLSPVTAQAAPVRLAAAARPSVTARSVAVYNRSTHAWLYLKQARTRRPIASVTKLMTAYVVLKHARWRTPVTISKAAVAYAHRHDATTANLRPGERITLAQALYGMLLPSGADVAYQLAKNYGPGHGKFIAKMNAYARALHMTKTHYANPDGLPYKDSHGRSGYSTAVDQLKLVNALLRSTSFRKVVRTTRYHLHAGHGHRAHTWTNTNRLLGAYRGAHGVKTGTTKAAGACLAFSAYRGTRNIIGIVLHSTTPTTRFRDATHLLNYAYGTHPTQVHLRSLPAGTNPD
ncbi:MAG TPA: serine hydrolase [Streptosporangiaceae bacterium]|jgi:D-alanyl-D-alanine carboxypeptidase (penicillin-binding protein 5/6)